MAHIAVIGAGGLGSAFLPLVAASGVGTLTLWDGDVVERSNLGRQTLYREEDIGRRKVDVAHERLSQLNPYVRIQAHAHAFEPGDSVPACDLVFEGSDSLRTKFRVNDWVVSSGRSAIIASLGNRQGHTMLVGGASHACYRCIFDEIDGEEIPNCASEGILSTFPAVVGAQAAHLAVQLLLGSTTTDSFWVFEKNHCRSVKIHRRQDCRNH